MFLHSHGKAIELTSGKLDTSNIVTTNGMTVCEFSVSNEFSFRNNNNPMKLQSSVSFADGKKWGIGVGRIVDNKVKKPILERYSKEPIILPPLTSSLNDDDY